MGKTIEMEVVQFMKKKTLASCNRHVIEEKPTEDGSFSVNYNYNLTTKHYIDLSTLNPFSNKKYKKMYKCVFGGAHKFF